MPDIDPKSPIPLYYQLKQLFQEKIHQGELKPGDRIPTEYELIERFGISRTPVRQALMELVHEGLLVRTPGRGTFVAEPAGQDTSERGTQLRVVFSDSRWGDLLESAAAFRNARRPEDLITLSTHQVPLWGIHDYLVNEVGRGTAPDISVLDSVWVAEFAHQHHLIPLDEVDPQWCQTIQDVSFPAMLAGNCYQGHLYGIPVCGDVTVLWYRRDWFENEGLSPPSTWEDLVAIGQHFQKPAVQQRLGGDPQPLVFVGGRLGGETTTYQLLPFLWSTGGELISGEHVLLDSVATRRALAFLKSLIDEHHLVPPEVVGFTWDHSAQVFASGRAAMALGGTYDSFFIREVAGWDEVEFLAKVGFVPIPAGPQGEPTTLAGGMNYVLYHQSSSVEKSLTMLKMAIESEILKPFCVRTGQIPAQIPIAQGLSREDDGFVAQTVPLLERARTRPSLPDFARVSAQFRGLIEDCLTGKRSIDQAVTLTAEKITAITDLPLG